MVSSVATLSFLEKWDVNLSHISKNKSASAIFIHLCWGRGGMQNINDMVKGSDYFAVW